MVRSILTIVFMLAMVTGLKADGLTPYFGLAMNGEQSQSNGVESESPLGLFGLRYEMEYGLVSIDHKSSIPQMNETQGINEITSRLHYKLGYTTGYISRIHNGDMTSGYYRKQIDRWSTAYGIEVNYTFGDIFIEYRPTNKRDLLIGGILIKFDPEMLR